MKKAYTKPEIVLVDFSLSSSIATTCRYTGTHADVTSCGYLNENGWITFTSPWTGCTSPALPSDVFCYHAPTADTSVFGS